MRYALFLLLVVLGSPAFAQCVDCGFDFNDCRQCIPTSYNGFGTCVLINNGSQCELSMFCEGPLGERCAPPAWNGCVEHQARKPEVQPRREWQLVSVTIERTRRTPRS